MSNNYCKTAAKVIHYFELTMRIVSFGLKVICFEITDFDCFSFYNLL